MGFKSGKIYNLIFEDPAMDGLEVRARSVPLGQFMEIAKLSKLGRGEVGAEGMEQVEKLLKLFAGALISWNVEADELADDGKPTGRDVPVPPTYEGLLTQDFDFVLEVIDAWMNAVAKVPESVGKASPSGAIFPEGSLPMAPPSHDLSKLIKQN